MTWLFDLVDDATSAVQDRSIQWLKWKIGGEGTVYQLWDKMGPQQVVLDSMKFELWERWISITGGAGTAFPCVQWHFNHWEHTISEANFAREKNFLKMHDTGGGSPQGPRGAPRCQVCCTFGLFFMHFPPFHSLPFPKAVSKKLK